MEAELREQDEYTMKVVVFRIQVRGHCTRSLCAPLLRVMVSSASQIPLEAGDYNDSRKS